MFIAAGITSLPFIFAGFVGISGWKMHIYKDCTNWPKPKTASERKVWLDSNVEEIKKKMGVQKKIEIIRVQEFSGCAQAMGGNFFGVRAGIIIDPAVFDADYFFKIPEDYMGLTDDQQRFILAHEISHIKNNDVLKISFAAAIASVISAIALSLLFAPISVPVLTVITIASLIIGMATFLFVSQKCELKADREAFNIIENKQEIIDNFQLILQDQIEYRNSDEGNLIAKLYRKIIISPSGENRLDIAHPSIKRRIKNLEGLLQNTLP